MHRAPTMTPGNSRRNNAMEGGSTLPQKGVPSWQPHPAT
jgi:hypothetical protein